MAVAAEQVKPGKAEPPRIDAGLRSEMHYRRLLPSWRYSLREFFIPVVRVETPYLAALQQKCRTPSLDAYFAFTANLGTHTFFMIILPILYWSGYSTLGRSMTQMLAAGVFFSGFLKDLFCIPRPLSPPLQRISRSHSAALEYGFPSTHSTNAVSVALYAIWVIRSSRSFESPNMMALVEGLFYFYAVSIVIGRMYCGMHGLFDVFFGSLLGVAIAAVQCVYEAWFDDWIINGPVQNVLIATLVTLVLVRIHPEPADDCPCFDDSVAFSGVFMGIQLGSWHFARSGFATGEAAAPSNIPFSIAELGWSIATARIIFGVFMVFAWRGAMKPTLLKILPPLFRIMEKLGLALPRKFFLRATQYGSVPALKKDDNIIPPASEIPSMINSLRHPRRRAISVGPQSEADAYEAMAFRARKRRAESFHSVDSPRSVNSSPVARATSPLANNATTDFAQTTAIRNSLQGPLRAESTVPNDYGSSSSSPVAISPVTLPNEPDADVSSLDLQAQQQEDDRQDREMFLRIQQPRVRYDVEVVTKLIVYAGIGFLSADVAPIIFELVGLGIGTRPSWVQ